MRGVAGSTHRTYQTGSNRFIQFCRDNNTQPFPVSERLLCYFVASLAQQGLAPSTIKVYLAGVRHAQIMQGYPEPRQSSNLPRLHLLQMGVRRVRAEQGVQQKPRLPITPVHLHQLRQAWNPLANEFNTQMIWAATTACFLAFLERGRSQYHQRGHLIKLYI